jgi:hypothetical protein
MSLNFSLLFSSKLVNNAAADLIYTVPAFSTLRNMKVRFSNSTATAATIKVWTVPSTGGGAGPLNLSLPAVSIPALSYIDVDLPVIDAGGMIQAQAGTASAIAVFHMDGLLQT